MRARSVGANLHVIGNAALPELVLGGAVHAWMCITDFGYLSPGVRLVFLTWLGRQHVQGQAQLTRRMAVRPASLASKAHRRLTAALDRRHVKFNRVQRTVTVLDPKKAKSDLEKDQEARIRSR